MYLINGQGRDQFYDPDRLYVVLRLAAEPRTYQVVIGWRDRNNRGDNNGRRLFN
jgi:hypothetical protein